MFPTLERITSDCEKVSVFECFRRSFGEKWETDWACFYPEVASSVKTDEVLFFFFFTLPPGTIYNPNYLA